MIRSPAVRLFKVHKHKIHTRKLRKRERVQLMCALELAVNGNLLLVSFF